MPVDLVDADETEFMMLLSDRLMQLCRKGDFLSHNSLRDAFRISRMVELYLRETVDSVTIKVSICTELQRSRLSQLSLALTVEVLGLVPARPAKPIIASG